MSVSQEVTDLGTARQAARAAKDFALADKLRDQIALLGWEVLDIPGGFDFRAIARFPSVARIGDVPAFSDKQFDITVALVVDGYCEDAALAIQSIKEHSNGNFAIAVLVVGTPDLKDLPDQLDERTFMVQVLSGCGWGEAANALLKYSPSDFVVIMDPSTRFTGDALTPVLQQLQAGEFSAVGWRGGLISTEAEWRETEDKGPGEVDVLYSYFLAVKREDALEAGAFNIRALYYRNADIEFSLRLRQTKGRLLQLDLPLEQARHHGYYDTDPDYRDVQSKKNYDRILDRFRGKNEILSPRR